MIDICPICGEGILHRKVEEAIVTHLGKVGLVPFLIDECSECHEESAGLEASRSNKNAVKAFRAKVEKELI
jgi:hypothetical protein